MDDEFELDAAALDEIEAVTLLRATILPGGRIFMTRWGPHLAEGGPMGQFLRGRERAGVAIADVRLERGARGEREVIVEFMAAGRAREAAGAALRRWAADTGHDRVWLPDGPVDVGGEARGLATASVRCPVCRSRWTDAAPDFWQHVQAQGHFPLTCPTCGHSLPQWDVQPGDATRCRGS